MLGKQKCKILKQIRAQIAEQNDINLVIEECTHKGECKGTCPRCEAEVRYLENELEKKRSAGKKIALAGLSAGLIVSMAGCSVTDTIDDIWNNLRPVSPDLEGVVELAGDVPNYTQTPIEDELVGELEYHE